MGSEHQALFLFTSPLTCDLFVEHSRFPVVVWARSYRAYWPQLVAVPENYAADCDRSQVMGSRNKIKGKA
jgi:hypothetical protein